MMSRSFKSTVLMTVVVMFILTIALSNQVMAKRKPDLTIRKITVDRNCNLAVVVRNNGPGALPNYVYTKHHPKSAGVFVYINGKSWGGKSIWKFDPARKLQKPGGHATCILNYKVGPPIDVKAVVDLWNDVKEANERNNAQTRKRLVCRPTPTKRLPDLVVRDIRLIKNCKIQVTIANIGTAGVPSSYYDNPDAVAVQMYKGSQAWGGMILKMFDPAGKLKSPGGIATHVWFPLAANLNLSPGTHSIKVIVDVHKKLTELNETNNSLTRRVTCKKLVSAIGTQIATTTRPPVLAIKPPKTLMLDFTDAYLVFSNPYKSIQIAAQSTVLSYGSDWEKCQLKPYLYHIRQKFWQGFYWQVNTSRKEVYEVTGGTFCRISPGTRKKLNIKVDVVGGSTTTPPDRFFLRFSEARLVYQVSTKILQLATGNKVLSYCQDFQKCNLSASVYHFKEKFWKGFYWKVNTIQKKVWKVNGTFCKPGTGGTLLSIGVRVFN
jgi:hypothetical protein